MPAAGAVTGAGVLGVGGRKVEWRLTNTGLETVTIESLHLVWPAANGDLEKLKLDSKKIFDDRQRLGFGVTAETMGPGSSDCVLDLA